MSDPAPDRENGTVSPDRSPGLATPRSVLRRIGGPLLLYHALVLVGAFFLITGVLDARPTWEGVGAALVVVGIGVEGGVLVWSARLARAAAETSPTRPVGPATPTPDLPHWLCPRCGARASGRYPTCPRCGAQRLRVYGFSPEGRADAPAP